MDGSGEDAPPPKEIMDLIFSDSYLRGKIKETARHEHTQVVGRERHAAAASAAADDAAPDDDGAPPLPLDDLERINTNGRWCPFGSKFHLPPLPPTAYFILDKKAMCMRPRCSAATCNALEAGDDGEEPPVISLAPTDEDVEYVRRKTDFERTHFKVICPKPFFVRENDDTGLPSHTMLDYLTGAQMLDSYGAMLPAPSIIIGLFCNRFAGFAGKGIIRIIDGGLLRPYSSAYGGAGGSLTIDAQYRPCGRLIYCGALR